MNNTETTQQLISLYGNGYHVFAGYPNNDIVFENGKIYFLNYRTNNIDQIGNLTKTNLNHALTIARKVSKEK